MILLPCALTSLHPPQAELRPFLRIRGQGWRSTYVGANDQDYGSFLAAWVKLKAPGRFRFLLWPSNAAQNQVEKEAAARAAPDYVDPLFPLDSRSFCLMRPTRELGLDGTR
ncbi:hypothetical protein KM043_010194 [Ampulex compressa]|nr:hypothetical protein KM043_010194 [Ampulex compressa]